MIQILIEKYQKVLFFGINGVPSFEKLTQLYYIQLRRRLLRQASASIPFRMIRAVC